MYYHTDDQSMVNWLAVALSNAAVAERCVRLDVDSEGRLRVKVGEGVWTSPFASTPDPYRNSPTVYHVDLDIGQQH